MDALNSAWTRWLAGVCLCKKNGEQLILTNKNVIGRGQSRVKSLSVSEAWNRESQLAESEEFKN
jgi:hypothetical protein